MKKLFTCGLLLLFFLLPLQGEVEFDIDMKVFLPRIYYVGDEVELQLKIRLMGENMEIRAPQQLPAQAWIEILEVYPVVFPADTLTLTVRFVTFSPGKHILPPLDLGDITLDGIEAETQSVIDAGAEKRIKPRRGQLELPGTRFKIVLTILSIVLLPLLIFLLIKYSLVAVDRIRQSHKKEVPRQKIRKALRRLSRLIPKLPSRQFYIRLADVLRDYLQNRFSVPALTLTSRELESFFSAAFETHPARQGILRCTRILREADGIKFGGRSSSEEEKHSRIEEILAIVDNIEQEPANVES